MQLNDVPGTWVIQVDMPVGDWSLDRLNALVERLRAWRVDQIVRRPGEMPGRIAAPKGRQTLARVVCVWREAQGEPAEALALADAVLTWFADAGVTGALIAQVRWHAGGRGQQVEVKAQVAPPPEVVHAA